jgi:hypothetical protein
MRHGIRQVDSKPGPAALLHFFYRVGLTTPAVQLRPAGVVFVTVATRRGGGKACVPGSAVSSPGVPGDQ